LGFQKRSGLRPDDRGKKTIVWNLITIKTITDNKMVSMKYLAAAILFDDFSLTMAHLCELFSIFHYHLTL
jgi:hypothetical protein